MKPDEAATGTWKKINVINTFKNLNLFLLFT